MNLEDGWRSYFVKVVKDKFNKLMIIFGNICSLKVVEKILLEGYVDLFVMGCGLIVEFNWVNKVVIG